MASNRFMVVMLNIRRFQNQRKLILLCLRSEFNFHFLSTLGREAFALLTQLSRKGYVQELFS